jgi:hypothetical protein
MVVILLRCVGIEVGGRRRRRSLEPAISSGVWDEYWQTVSCEEEAAYKAASNWASLAMLDGK